MDSVNIFRAENTEGRIDVGNAVGSSATLMFVYDVAPGERQCPYHYEYDDEWPVVRGFSAAAVNTRSTQLCFSRNCATRSIWRASCSLT